MVIMDGVFVDAEGEGFAASDRCVCFLPALAPSLLDLPKGLHVMKGVFSWVEWFGQPRYSPTWPLPHADVSLQDVELGAEGQNHTKMLRCNRTCTSPRIGVSMVSTKAHFECRARLASNVCQYTIQNAADGGWDTGGPLNCR